MAVKRNMCLEKVAMPERDPKERATNFEEGARMRPAYQDAL